MNLVRIENVDEEDKKKSYSVLIHMPKDGTEKKAKKVKRMKHQKK